MPHGPEQRLMSPAQVADMLGVKTNTLAIWRCQKKGPPFLRVGRLIRYEAASVMQWAGAKSAQV